MVRSSLVFGFQRKQVSKGSPLSCLCQASGLEVKPRLDLVAVYSLNMSNTSRDKKICSLDIWQLMPVLQLSVLFLLALTLAESSKFLIVRS